MTEQFISLKLSDFVKGGAVPVDRNLLVLSARFCNWDYQGKAPATLAAKIDFRDDDGNEYTQYYSFGDPVKYGPSEDGKRIVPLSTSANLSESSNGFILLREMVNAGFPENRIGDDISVIENLYAYWVGVQPPERKGLKHNETTPVDPNKQQFEKVILVPSKILKLPWDNVAPGKQEPIKTAVKPPAAPSRSKATSTATPPPVTPPPSSENTKTASQRAVDFIGELMNKNGVTSITRQNVAVAVFQQLGNDPQRDDIANVIFTPELAAALMAAGYKIKGEDINK